MPANYPTPKQRAALIRFQIPMEQINKMTFSDASAKLDELIGQARKHDASSKYPNSIDKSGKAALNTTGQPSAHISAKEVVSQRLSDACEIVNLLMPEAKDYADYYALVAEVMRELYGSEWLNKI